MNSPNSNEFNLDSIPVRVNKVKFDGLSRTKTSFVDPTTENVYKAKTFGDASLIINQNFTAHCFESELIN